MARITPPSNAGFVFPTPPVGAFYPDGGQQTSMVTTDQWVYLVPMRLPSGTIDRIQINVVTTPGSAGSVHRLGLYKQTAGARFAVADLIGDAGTVDTTATGLKLATVSYVIPGNLELYFVAVAQQANPTTKATLRAIGAGYGSEFGGVPLIGGGYGNNLASIRAAAAASGALASTVTGAPEFTSLPWAQVRYA